MNWKKWLTYNPYKKLWSLVGKRPWTFIYRDIYRKFEYFIQFQWFITGVVILYYFGWKGSLWFWLSYSFGYINGHFFWGKKIIEGQKDNGKDR